MRYTDGHLDRLFHFLKLIFYSFLRGRLVHLRARENRSLGTWLRHTLQWRRLQLALTNHVVLLRLLSGRRRTPIYRRHVIEHHIASPLDPFSRHSFLGVYLPLRVPNRARRIDLTVILGLLAISAVQIDERRMSHISLLIFRTSKRRLSEASSTCEILLNPSPS